MRYWYLIIIIGCWVIYPTVAQSGSKKDIIKQLSKDVYFLASDSLEGRAPSSKGEKIAANFLEERFQKLDLRPLFGKQFQHYFSYPYRKDTISTVNLCARTKGCKPIELLIVAHYDHLGYGNAFSRDIGKKAIHNGADDNASGVALLLALAAHFKQKKLNFGIGFICLSGHEVGLFGARRLVRDKRKELSASVKWLINLDMVGRLDTSMKKVYFRVPDEVSYFSEIQAWSDSVESPAFEVQVKTQESPLDNSIFYAIGIKGGTLSTGIHNDYHSHRDDAHKINYEGIFGIYKYILKMTDGQIWRNW